MRSPADIIYQLLVNLELGSVEGEWPISVGLLPDTPDEAICVYDTAGRPDGRLMSTGERIDHPGIQIRVKGKDYPTVYQKIKTIATTLDRQAAVSIAFSEEEAYIIDNVSRTGDILPVGIEEVDGRRCHHFTLNATLTLRERN